MMRISFVIETREDGSTPPVGIVLAGGASRRMGRDKSKLGEALLPRKAAALLAEVCPEVAVADRGRGLVPGLPSLPDGPGRGPAAGLLGAALAYPGRPLLALACDLPNVPGALLAALANPTADWALPRWTEGIEPLCALYGPTALAALTSRVERGLFALHSLAEEGLTVLNLEGDDLARFGPPEKVFLNLNTPEDVVRWGQGLLIDS